MWGRRNRDYYVGDMRLPPKESSRDRLAKTAVRLRQPVMSLPWLPRYGVTVLAVLLALGLKLLLEPLIREESPFLIFFGAVMVSAWFGGLRSGLLATALSALASSYFFLPPVYSFGLEEGGQRIRLALFVMEGSFIGGLTAVLQRARQRTDESAREAVAHQETLRRSQQALLESTERYRAVVEQAAESIFMADPETWSILDSNAAFRDLLGYAEEELAGMTLYDFVAHDPDSIEGNALRLREQGQLYIGERQYRRKDGSLVDVEVNVSVIRYGGKHMWSVVSHDVTERKRTERQLRGTLDNLLALYEAGRILGSSLEREEIGSQLLEIARRVSNLMAAVLILRDRQGRPGVLNTAGPQGVLDAVLDRPVALDARRSVLETGRHEMIELPGMEIGALTGLVMPLRVRERTIGVLEVYGPRDLAEEQTVETLTSIAGQAAGALENARLYEDLAGREHELQDLVGRVMVAQEEERRRIAYEVHDRLTQLSVAAFRRLEVFAEDHASGSDRDRKDLAKITELVRRSVGESRRVIADLRPTTLDDFGLATAVRMHIEAFREEGYRVDYEETLDEVRLPVTLETALYRVAQEALNNTRKHARTDRVRVVLERAGGAVRLEVRDWGRGFDPDESAALAGPGERVGLSSMRERMALLGGELEIIGEPGIGTSVVARVPIPAAGEDTSRG